jgi:hypothetical protein
VTLQDGGCTIFAHVSICNDDAPLDIDISNKIGVNYKHACTSYAKSFFLKARY